MGLGINTISLLEIREEGVLWSNFYKEISLDDDFNLGYVFLMLIIDSIIYMLIAWYVILFHTSWMVRYYNMNNAYCTCGSSVQYVHV